MSRVYALYQLPHPIPRAGFSLNRRQPEPSDRSRHPLAHPHSRQRHPANHSPLLLLSLCPSRSIPTSLRLLCPSLPLSLFSLCSASRHAVCGGVCAERFLRARAFNDSRFRFRNETILWQRSTALQRTENGENGRLFASQGFPPISLSRRAALYFSLCFPRERRKI